MYILFHGVGYTGEICCSQRSILFICRYLINLPHWFSELPLWNVYERARSWKMEDAYRATVGVICTIAVCGPLTVLESSIAINPIGPSAAERSPSSIHTFDIVDTKRKHTFTLHTYKPLTKCVSLYVHIYRYYVCRRMYARQLARAKLPCICLCRIVY